MDRKVRAKMLSLLLVLAAVGSMLFPGVTAPFGGGNAAVAETAAALRNTISPTVPTHTFVFMNGEEEHARVILKGEEILPRPENPEREGLTFLGWYEDEDLTTEFDGFGKTAEMDDGTTTVYAGFDGFCFLTYYNQDNRVIKTERMNQGTEYTFAPRFPMFDTGSLTSQNVGWKDQDGITYTTETVSVTKDMKLTPVLREGYWVRFDSQGGSATLSEFVSVGGKAAKPADPTRMGYTFDGWYDAADGGTAFDFDTVLTGSATVYAHWISTNVNYTVVVWVEQDDYVSPMQYSYLASFTRTAPAGTQLTNGNAGDYGDIDIDAYKTDAEARIRTARSGHMPYVFQPDVSKANNLNVSVKGDGTTLLNLYYRYKTLHVQFTGDPSVAGQINRSQIWPVLCTG